MESQNEFRMNEKIEISEENGEFFYKTIVLGVNSESIMIGMPMFRSNILLLYEKDRVVIKRIKDNAVYYYSSQILSRQREDQVPLYQIQYPQLFERVQRRKFLRLPCMLQINYRPLQPGDEISQDFYTSQTIDISGGGVKFYTDYDFSLGQFLEVELILPHYTLRTHARVVKTAGGKGFNDRDGGKWAAVEFYQLHERERDTLVAFIFKKLRERL